jgi:hypothetical protein
MPKACPSWNSLIEKKWRFYYFFSLQQQWHMKRKMNRSNRQIVLIKKSNDWHISNVQV